MKNLDLTLLTENIEKAANYDLENNNISGSSYFVFQKNGLSYKKHFGCDLKDSSPVGDGTIFRLASMTKPITAFAMMILIDRGLISLDTKVKDFFPELSGVHVVTPAGEDLGEAKSDVTVLNLLSHTSGIGSLKSPTFTLEEKSDAEKMVKAFLKNNLDFEPGTRADYSAVAAFSVALLIVEKVSGMPFYEFLKKEIFTPLGMTDTAFIPTDEQEKRIIAMHTKVDDKNAIGDMPSGCIFVDFPWTNPLGGAGLFSTLKDYIAFAKMLLAEGETEDGTALISKETFRLMKTPQVPQNVMPQNVYSWGLSVRIITNPNYPTLPVGGYGWSGAYGSHFWIDPENEICAVFMKNSKFDGGAGNKSAMRFEEAVYKSFKE